MTFKPIPCLLLCGLLVACGGSGYRAPVEDRKVRQHSAPSVYTVQRGETLYSIAWRYGLDYRQLAAANGIESGYTIFPGQKLYLKKKAPAPQVSEAAPKSAPAARGSTAASAGAASAPARVPGPVTSATAPAAAKPPPPANARVKKWQWPTSGKVVRGFSSTLHKGIDIDGKRGDPIRAVAAGRVVYAGTGIVGFGELLIIKHNDVYLSAYGHNDRLLVTEGADVRAGQVIADKGSSGTNSVKLHFEIRKEGKPVDPIKLLGRR